MWNFIEEAKKFPKFLKKTYQEFFCGCKKHNTLSFILELFHKKCMNGWSNKSFTKLLDTLRETFLEGETLPKSSYEVKKIISELGLRYEKKFIFIQIVVCYFGKNMSMMTYVKYVVHLDGRKMKLVLTFFLLLCH